MNPTSTELIPCGGMGDLGDPRLAMGAPHG